MPVDTQWFRDRLADQRMSQRGLARSLGLDPAAVSLMLRGKREMRIAEAAAIARLLGVPADEVMANAGVSIRSGGTQVPVNGWMDEATEVHFVPGHEDTVAHPGGELPDLLGACQCKTAGTQLEHMDGWILFVARISPAQGIPPEAVGRLSIVKVRNGLAYVAKLARSHKRGRWNLQTPNGTIADVDVEWANPVLLVQP